MSRNGLLLRAGITAVLLAGMIISGGCQCGNELVDPVFENPLDPEAENYTPPQVIVTSPVGDGDTAFTASLTFTFSDTGNIADYRYRLEYQQAEFTPWTSENSVSYNYLDEGPNELFVEVRTATGIRVTDTVSFYVDAVTGPTLVLRPRYTEVDVNQEFTLEVMAEEVTDLMLAEVYLTFSGSFFRAESVAVGDFLSQGGAAAVLLDTISTGAVTLNVGRVSPDGNGISGSGVVARVTFKALSQTGSTPRIIGFSTADTSALFSAAWSGTGQGNSVTLGDLPVASNILVKQ